MENCHFINSKSPITTLKFSILSQGHLFDVELKKVEELNLKSNSS